MASRGLEGLRTLGSRPWLSDLKACLPLCTSTAQRAMGGAVCKVILMGHWDCPDFVLHVPPNTSRTHDLSGDAFWRSQWEGTCFCPLVAIDAGEHPAVHRAALPLGESSGP